MSELDPLIARLRQHDAAALGEFLQLRRFQLLAFIERQLGQQLRQKVEPEDVYQEACAEAVRAFPAAQFDQRDPFGWLCQLAERKIIDLHRHHFDAQKRDAGKEVALAPPADTQSPGLVNMLIASMTSVSQAFSRDARELRLQAALRQLPDDQREALRLRYVEDLPSKEIAERLQKTDAAVRVMLTRSLRKLEEILGER